MFNNRENISIYLMFTNREKISIYYTFLCW